MTTTLREARDATVLMRRSVVDDVSATLVVRAQLGDVPALDAVLRSVQDAVYDHIAYIMRDPDAAKDVLQTVLLTVCRTLIQLQNPRLFRAWVFRIATRAAVRARHRSRWHEASIPEDVPDLTQTEREPVVDDDLASLLRQLVDELPPACGVAVRLRYLEELSLAEVAEALDVPVGTVKSRIAYGIELLRQRVNPVSGG